MDALQELFGVLRQLGFERRDSSPIARVPEKPATIYVDVKSWWALPSWKSMALLFGLCHGYPRTNVNIVAGMFLGTVGPWFDAWIARAHAAPRELIAERRSDGTGVILWREPPTRASIFRRLDEVNASRPSAAPAALAPVAAAPVAPPSAWQVVAGAQDAPRAWAALAGAGRIPPTWANASRRFRHQVTAPCPACGGAGTGQGYGETACYGPGCSRGWVLVDRWEPIPASVAACVTVAEDAPGIERFEALCFDLVARTAAWQPVVYDPRGVAVPWAPSVARWFVFETPRSYAPGTPSPLHPVWYALQSVVPDLLTPADPRPWSEKALHAWATAVARGLRVAPHRAVPPALVGRAFAELGDPFATARELQALPYELPRADPWGLDLWAYPPAPRP